MIFSIFNFWKKNYGLIKKKFMVHYLFFISKKRQNFFCDFLKITSVKVTRDFFQKIVNHNVWDFNVFCRNFNLSKNSTMNFFFQNLKIIFYRKLRKKKQKIIMVDLIFQFLNKNRSSTVNHGFFGVFNIFS